ncbi:hypothetical protein MMC18_009229 [Xylographa bjoerkii]|nr:hypothetical protein [Xylographa bjoerkii]
MSLPAQNTSLSLSARLLCYLGPPSVVLLTAFASPKTALLSPLAFLPTAWFFRKWRESNDVDASRRGELESIIWLYAAAGTVGLCTVALVQIVICKAASAILFGSDEMRKSFWTEFQRSTIDGLTAAELTRRAKLAASWQNWAFNSVLTFVAAGLTEEILKYLPIAYARRRGTAKQRQRRNRAYIDYVLAGALSFGLIESIGFLYAFCKQGHESWPKLVLTLFERIVLGQLGHMSIALLTALRAIRRDYYGDQLSWWSVVGPSVILHGTFDFGALAASALEGNVGWIHPTGVRHTTVMLGLGTGLVVGTAWQVRQEWEALDNRDRAGQSFEDDSASRRVQRVPVDIPKMNTHHNCVLPLIPMNMEVWCGHATLDRHDANNKLEDLRFCLPREVIITSQWANVNLQFLSFVNPAAVPLHLVAGPSFDVFTANENTEKWLSDRLLSSSQLRSDEVQPPSKWWKNKRGQSDVGVLLQVDGQINTAQYSSRVTELLIYAGLPKYTGPDHIGMLTPPRSSSPVADHGGSPEDSDRPVETVNVYALPLSSDLPYSFQDSLNPPSPPSEEPSHEYAQFLPLSTEDHPRPKGRKRLHLDSLFQDATHQVKRSKKRGGESIAKAMASLDKPHSPTVEQSTSHHETVGSGTQFPTSLFFGKPRLERHSGLFRAHSLGSLRDLNRSRPPSRGNTAPARRSTLSRVASVGVFESISPAPESPSDIEQQNKAALSRVVMAGMRIYGLQQKKKSDRSRAASEVPLSAGPMSTTRSIADDEDEYKLVYHQTYKAASFAIRKYISVVTMGQDGMRDIVDRILEMFCVDYSHGGQSEAMSQQVHDYGAETRDGPFGSLSTLECGKSPDAHSTRSLEDIP